MRTLLSLPITVEKLENFHKDAPGMFVWYWSKQQSPGRTKPRATKQE